MSKIAKVVGIATAGIALGLLWWRRHPRVGSAYVNRVVDPWLIRNEMVGRSAGEIGLVEHIGRRSGTLRVSPVHPVPIRDGFRIIVPLGEQSQWARNVIATGHCRLQIGEFVHEVDEPKLVSPIDVPEMPALVGQFMDWLGFRYLILHQLTEHFGTLNEPVDVSWAATIDWARPSLPKNPSTVSLVG